jgi:hypothetical protein
MIQLTRMVAGLHMGEWLALAIGFAAAPLALPVLPDLASIQSHLAGYAAVCFLLLLGTVLASGTSGFRLMAATTYHGLASIVVILHGFLGVLAHN